MKTGLALVSSAVAGAALTYFLDPTYGNRRRVETVDRAARRLRRIGHFLDMARRDLGNRAVGVFAEARYRIRGRHPSDDQLGYRVAAKLGRYVSHPKAVEVIVENGCVTLGGCILKHETKATLRAIAAIPGVKSVRSELEEHAEPDGSPSLQGGRPRFGDRRNVLQENWSPATRLLLGAAGSTIAVDGLRRASAVGTFETLIGSVLLARSSVNRPLRNRHDQGGPSLPSTTD